MLDIDAELAWLVKSYPEFHLDKPQHMMASVFNKSGVLLNWGVNSYVKTHPLQAKYAAVVNQHARIFLHAEISALVRARDFVHELVVVRFNPTTKELRPSKPCLICMEAMRMAGVKRVHFINKKGVSESHAV